MDRRRFITIFLIVFTNILGAGVIIPILALYAEGRLGATPLQATTLSAAYSLAMFFAAPVLGRWADRWGRRPVLLLSQVGTVLSFLLLIFATQIGGFLEQAGLQVAGIGGALLIAYAARILDGITGGNITVAQAYMTDITKPEDRAQALGALSAAFGLGFIFGPVLGGLLSRVNVVAPFIGAALITCGTVLLTYLTLEESLPAEARLKVPAQGGRSGIPLSQLLSNSGVVLILLTTFLIWTPFAALQTVFALFADRVLFPTLDEQLVAQNVGLILSFVGVMSVITQGVLIRPLIRWLGERRLVVMGIASLIIGFWGIGTAQGVTQVMISIVPNSFGQGVNQPALQALLTRFGGEQGRGQLLGIYQSVNSLALILGPFFAGILFERFDPHSPFLFSIPLLLGALGCSLLLMRQPDPHVSVSLH